MNDVADATLDWAATTVHPDGVVRAVERLRTDSGPWLLRIEHPGGVTTAVLKCGPAPDWRPAYTCEVAALRFAATHELPVPRLLGVLLDGDPVALLLSRLPGTTNIPTTATTERLRSLGEIAAAVHRIALEPSRDLPLRTRHTAWVDYALWRRLAARYREASADQRAAVLKELPGWGAEEADQMLSTIESTPLLDESDRRCRDMAIPGGGTVFVHGDLWQGNTVWDGDTCTGVIDWETAGAGHYGVDLGCLRWDAAILFDPSAADEITAAWEEAIGDPATDTAYWDLVAGLNTPADMTAFVSSFHEAGRTDLNGETLNSRRDAFLESALDRLQAHGDPVS